MAPRPALDEPARRRVHRAAGIVVTILAACTPPPPPPPTPPTVATAAPTATASAPVRESPRRTDPRWMLAAGEDALEKARLAHAVGATELLAGVADGGEIADTALAALPYADDGEIALGPLATLLRPGLSRRAILSAILGIAGRPRHQREALDPEGAKRCAEALLALAADGGAPPEERALAVSAARALAEHGYVDRARIPE
ncbi:Hypothetical protein A7982_02433 [Minicystis rosea]|nr:Hypothetical protein A7982_02433 [Minicystis rosea]